MGLARVCRPDPEALPLQAALVQVGGALPSPAPHGTRGGAWKLEGALMCRPLESSSAR